MTRLSPGIHHFTPTLSIHVFDAPEPGPTALIQAGARCPPLLVDQGEADGFLAEQLHPHLFEAACREAARTVSKGGGRCTPTPPPPPR